MFSVLYFIDNKLGGVSSLNYNLITHPLQDEQQLVVEIEQEEWAMSRAHINYPVPSKVTVLYSGKSHAYELLKQLRSCVPDTAGAMVLNYENEMVMLDHYRVQQTTYQLVHDDYNVRLAAKYGYLVDVFICHNTVIFEKLINMYPEKKDRIFHLPHGVQLPVSFRKQDGYSTKPLKLMFLGRMAINKGIFDLPKIHEGLRENGVAVEWLCIGNGPEKEAAMNAWPKEAKVTFVSPATNAEVMDLAAQQDVFVLPTKFEGSPVSLLEAMSAGLVPVISKLPGGITDLVDASLGFTPELNDNRGFAEAILSLHHDRARLKTLSENCRAIITEKFDVRHTARKYHELFQQYNRFYQPKKLRKQKIGARLDHPFIPPFVTKLIRKISS